MARIYEFAYFNDAVCPIGDATLNVATSAVLYGLSVYTVLPVNVTPAGELVAFRLADHFRRLQNSAAIVGIDTFAPAWTLERFEAAVAELVASNAVSEPILVRVSVHVTDLLPGTRSRGLGTTLSVFLYDAKPILPQNGARLKTSVWRRIPDFAIPSRAKVNGAYVNSVLAKQDAVDSGYDDCILLDGNGHVCELSAANIFLVRDGTLITPGTASDILEGINRRTVIEFALREGISVVERTVDLTELYVADEVFAAGTSAFLAYVKEIDSRRVADGERGPVTAKLTRLWEGALTGRSKPTGSASLLTVVGHVRVATGSNVQSFE